MFDSMIWLNVFEYRKEAQRCYCEAENCRGWIGGEPDSDEELGEDDDEDDGEESEEDDEQSTENRDDASETNELKISDSDESIKRKSKANKIKKVKDITKKPKKERKATTKMVKTFKKRMKRLEIMEDPDIDKEIEELGKSGLKNQQQTLKLSRLMRMITF